MKACKVNTDRLSICPFVWLLFLFAVFLLSLFFPMMLLLSCLLL